MEESGVSKRIKREKGGSAGSVAENKEYHMI
jgi:hypothetical protein